MPPGVGYYGGAPNAFAGGSMFQRDRRNLDYQENALRALIERFGPEAGNPVAWGQVQTIDQNRQRFPYVMNETRRLDTAGDALVHQYGPQAGNPVAWGQAQRIDQSEQLFPHVKGDAERRTAANEANAERFGPAAGDPTAHGIQEQERGYLRSAALSAARGLQAAKAKGGDIGAAFDRSVAVLQGIGLPADAIAGFREQIVNDPDFVDEFVAMLSGVEGTGAVRRAVGNPVEVITPEGELRFMQNFSDGTREIIDGYTPARGARDEVRLGQNDRRVTLAELQAEGWDAEEGHRIYEDAETGEWYQRPMEGTSASREVEDRDRRITAEEHAERQAAQEQVQIADLALNSLENTLAQMDRWGGMQGGENNWSSGLRAIQGLPGVRAVTDVGRFMEEIQTLKAHVALDRLAAIKATGATLGQITERELTLLENSMGNLNSPSRSPELIRKDLETIRTIMEDARDRAEAALAGRASQTGSGGGGAPPPGGGGGDWRARARQLQSEGRSQQEITRILREEGLIAGGGG